MRGESLKNVGAGTRQKGSTDRSDPHKRDREGRGRFPVGRQDQRNGQYHKKTSARSHGTPSKVRNQSLNHRKKLTGVK